MLPDRVSNPGPLTYESGASYGAAIWGIKEYSTINTVQHKACRFFLAVNGDMGWMLPHIKQLKTVLCHWFRLNHMDDKRVNKHVFQWSYSTRQNI